MVLAMDDIIIIASFNLTRHKKSAALVWHLARNKFVPVSTREWRKMVPALIAALIFHPPGKKTFAYIFSMCC
jgi:hypothetical protein